MDSRGGKIDCFPSGLRVLVVDADSNLLHTFEKMLHKCEYTVTKCSVLQEALDKLRERKDTFDIVICDANMSGDGSFKFVDQVVSEISLPVLMMSADKNKDDRKRKAIKGFQHGACGFLHRPIQMKELCILWHHAVREQMQRAGSRRLLENQANRNGNDAAAEQSDHLNTSSDRSKRKDVDDNSCKHPEKEDAETSSRKKKPGVVCTAKRQVKFLDANRIDNDKIRPERILEFMNEAGLWRANVASHLLNQTRNDQNAAAPGQMIPMSMQRHYDYPSPVQRVNSCYQNMINQNSPLMQPTLVANESYGVPRYVIRNATANDGFEGVIQHQLSRTCSTIITSNDPRMTAFTQSYGPLYSEAPPNQFNSQFQVPSELRSQFQEQHQSDHLPLPLEALPVQHGLQFQAEHHRYEFPVPSESPQIEARPSNDADIRPSHENALVCLPSSSSSQWGRHETRESSTGEPGPAPDKQANGDCSLQNDSSAENENNTEESIDLSTIFNEQELDDILTWYFDEI